MSQTLSPARRDTLRRRIRIIVAITISYNVIEAVIAISAGAFASSTALVAFGLDSIVEVLSAIVVAWQFSARDSETREKIALRLIALSFFALATYVIIDTGLGLIVGHAAKHSPVGIVLAVVSLAIMPVLSWIERHTGRELGSATAIADSKQTLLCAYLSGALLLGLLLNTLFGWSWADSLAALAIAGWAIKEGIQAWQGEACAVPVAALTGERTIEHDHHDDDCTDDQSRNG